MMGEIVFMIAMTYHCVSFLLVLTTQFKRGTTRTWPWRNQWTNLWRWSNGRVWKLNLSLLEPRWCKVCYLRLFCKLQHESQKPLENFTKSHLERNVSHISVAGRSDREHRGAGRPGVLCELCPGLGRNCSHIQHVQSSSQGWDGPDYRVVYKEELQGLSILRALWLMRKITGRAFFNSCGACYDLNRKP